MPVVIDQIEANVSGPAPLPQAEAESQPLSPAKIAAIVRAVRRLDCERKERLCAD
jgi:hypothetical protein